MFNLSVGALLVQELLFVHQRVNIKWIFKERMCHSQSVFTDFIEDKREELGKNLDTSSHQSEPVSVLAIQSQRHKLMISMH